MDQQDPMAQETMQNVEPYGASLLRQFHEDCACLLMEYDSALAPLDNPAVQQFMAEVMKTLERQFLMGAEKLFKKTYKQLPPLDGGEGDPAMTEEELPPEDGGDMDDVVVEMDEEELPPEMSGEDFPAEVGEEAPAEAPVEEDPKKGEKSLTGTKGRNARSGSTKRTRHAGLMPGNGYEFVEIPGEGRFPSGMRSIHYTPEGTHVRDFPFDDIVLENVNPEEQEKSLTARKYVDGMGQEMAGGMNSEDPASSEPRRQPTPDEVVEGMQTKKQAKSIVFSITPIAGGKGFRVVENHGQKSLRADLTVKGINKYLTRFKGSGAKSLLDGLAKNLNAGKAVKFALSFSRKALSKEDYEPAAEFGWREPYSRRGGPRLSNAAASTPAEIGNRTLDETGGQGSTEVIDYHVDDPDANFIGELPVAILDNHPHARPTEMTEEAVRKRADRYMKSLCKNCKSADCKCGKSLKKSAQDVLPPGEEVDAAALHGQAKALDLVDWAREEESEPEHNQPQSNDNQPLWVSLFDDNAKGALKLGYEFLTKLSMPDKIDLTDEDRLDAYHLHKMLEPVAVSGAKFLSGQKATIPPSRPNRPPSLDGNKQSQMDATVPIPIQPVPIPEDEGSKYLKSCGHCSSYFKMLSREKAFGQPHRDEAGYLAKEVEKMLGALCPQGTKDVGEPSSEEAAAATMGQYELGDLEEKDLKALTEEVQAQEKQLDSLSKLFSSAR